MPDRGPDSFRSPPSPLDWLLSIPRGIYLGGFVLGAAIATLPLLAIHVVA